MKETAIILYLTCGLFLSGFVHSISPITSHYKAAKTVLFWPVIAGVMVGDQAQGKPPGAGE